MGEISEDMYDGTCCSLCGQYFKDPNTEELYTHGYAVVCNECWPELDKEDTKYYQKAKAKTL